MGSDAQARKALDKAIAEHGSLRKFALAAKLSAPYVSDVVLGRRPIGPKLASFLGYEIKTKPASRSLVKVVR